MAWSEPIFLCVSDWAPIIGKEVSAPLADSAPLPLEEPFSFACGGCWEGVWGRV